MVKIPDDRNLTLFVIATIRVFIGTLVGLLGYVLTKEIYFLIVGFLLGLGFAIVYRDRRNEN
ncbi:hypothetical protein HMPREF9318_01717 [Streptococcus urinalis FB127-CNA-2]|uniref:Uncharacterized protein n=1 Tax=Streptococcus urinalis 2285-97 TaxID=764291 RepID=G5KEC9_9STRE|nr:hypothetical protein [Streptococcus urinalis]EHJ55682.1 hypothetical protein STRUR_2067 [Streptococcus urinalis 2285-97]EKS18218.1 hypothetical protein HMPREF9318_01717 [Streptococcus urinalis FB127-CNA-2]VEF32907.1 Uncharacterised protein [Streptococcus urinalis]